MAKLRRMPIEKKISGVRKTIDFYYYMGLPCVRLWPKSPGHRRAPQVQAGWVAFKEAAQLAKELSPVMIAFYQQNSAGTHLTWKDLFFRSYMKGLPTEAYRGDL